MIRAVVQVTNSWDLSGALVVRLLGAALLGGVIGAERENAEQAAGLRTHIAVALGAALFGAISTLGFQEFDRPRAETTLQADVTRVASNVAVGIGFLGAGIIFRQGHSIKNLTTAASLWVVAAIGLAAGVGDLTIAAVGTVVLLVSLVLLRPIRTFIRRGASEHRRLRIVLGDRGGVGNVIDVIGGFGGVVLRHVDVDAAEEETVVTAALKGSLDDARRLLADVSALPGVVAVTEDEGGT